MTVRCPTPGVAGPTTTSVPAFVARGAPPRLNVMCTYYLYGRVPIISRRRRIWCGIYYQLGVWRFARAEHFSRVSQALLNLSCLRVRASEYAPRDPCRVLYHLHGLADIIECGSVVLAECICGNRPHRERDGRSAGNHSRRTPSRPTPTRLLWLANGLECPRPGARTYQSCSRAHGAATLNNAARQATPPACSRASRSRAGPTRSRRIWLAASSRESSDAFRRSPRPRIPDVSGCSFSPPLSSNQMHPKLLEDKMIILLSIPYILKTGQFSSVLHAARSELKF